METASREGGWLDGKKKLSPASNTELGNVVSPSAGLREATCRVLRRVRAVPSAPGGSWKSLQGLLVGLGETQLLWEPNHARIPSIYADSSGFLLLFCSCS